MDLEILKHKHDQWIAKALARGDRLLTYHVPCCGGEMQDPAAPEGEVWDTMARCPHCGECYMKITHHTFIEALRPEGV